jgi:multidrug transporter EmrE-like cation transporter
MNIKNTSIILLTILFNSLSQILLKVGAEKIGSIQSSIKSQNLLAVFISPPILIGLILYIVSFALWVVVLSEVEVSVAYPMLSFGYIFVALLACFFLNETLTLNKILSISVIIIGVLMLNRNVAN